MKRLIADYNTTLIHLDKGDKFKFEDDDTIYTFISVNSHKSNFYGDQYIVTYTDGQKEESVYVDTFDKVELVN